MHTNSLPPTDRDEAAEPLSAQPGTETPAAPEHRVPIDRNRVTGDLVNKSTANLPDHQRSAIRRLHAYYVEQDLTLEECGKLLKTEDGSAYSSYALSLAFHGKYGAKLDNIVAAINRFFALEDKRGQSRKIPYIANKLGKRIWSVCASALEFQRIAFIFGDQQIGKSTALQSYQAAHNHGSTVYVEMPTGGALTYFISELAAALRISTNARMVDLRRRIIDAFDGRMLLIVDEIHRTVDDLASARAVQSVEFIRELFNKKQCGVVLCGTNVFRDSMDNGSLQKILCQTRRRRLCMLQLPNTPTVEDLNTFAAAYDLPPAKGEALDLQKRMVESEALGMWLTLLRMGAKIATQRNKRMEWAHVLSAHAGLQQLESGKN